MKLKSSICAATLAVWSLGSAHGAQVAPAAAKMTGLTFSVTALPGYTGSVSIVPEPPKPTDQIAVSERGTTPIGQEWQRFTEYTSINSDASVTLPSGQASIARQGTDLAANSHLDTDYIGLRSGKDGAYAATHTPVRYSFTLSPQTSLTVTAQFSYSMPTSSASMGLDQLPTNVLALAAAPNGFVELESVASGELDLTLYDMVEFDRPIIDDEYMYLSSKLLLAGETQTFTPYLQPSSVLAPAADGMYNFNAVVTLNVINPKNYALQGSLINNLTTASYFTASGTVPEPSSWALMGLGLAGVAGVATRRRQTTRQAA